MNKGWVWKLEFLMHLLQWGDPLVLQLHDPFPLVLLVGSGLFWPGSFCNLAFLCGVCSSAGQSAPEFPSDGGASLTLTNETFVTRCTVWLCILTCARVACWSCGHHAVGFVREAAWTGTDCRRKGAPHGFIQTCSLVGKGHRVLLAPLFCDGVLNDVDVTAFIWRSVACERVCTHNYFHYWCVWLSWHDNVFQVNFTSPSPSRIFLVWISVILVILIRIFSLGSGTILW